MLREVELDENALEYIKEELASGDALAGFLLDSLNFEQGITRTFLPNDLIDEKNIDFRSSVAKEYRAMYSETHEKIAGFISAYLSQQENRLVIFETLASPNNPLLKERKLQHFTHQRNVYSYLTRRNLDEQGASKIILGARGYPCIGILTSFSDGEAFLHQKSVTDDILQKLVAETEHIIIGAFDEDGFILWSKKRA